MTNKKNTNSRLFLTAVIIFFLVPITVIVCMSIVNTNNQNKKSTTESELMYSSFEEAVQMSNGSAIGTFQCMNIHDTYVEYMFSIQEYLYGPVGEEIIYLFYDIRDLIEESKSLEETITLIDIFVPNHTYLLIYDFQSTLSKFSDHPRYYFPKDVCIDLSSHLVFFRSREVEIPAGQSITDYVLSIHSAQGNQLIYPEEVTYKGSIDELCQSSSCISEVKIISLLSEGIDTNSQTYRCEMLSNLNGNPGNLDQDGYLIIVFFSDSVEIGQEYIVGYDPVGIDSSIVHAVTSQNTLFKNDVSVKKEISAFLNR